MTLTPEQKNDLADKINDQIDLPILGEAEEKTLIPFAIDKVLAALDDKLPDSLKSSIHDVEKGIETDAENFIKIKMNTVAFLNKEINLPIIGERAEERIFNLIVRELFEAMRKGNKL